jgi:hypothetical protein
VNLSTIYTHQLQSDQALQIRDEPNNPTMAQPANNCWVKVATTRDELKNKRENLNQKGAMKLEESETRLIYRGVVDKRTK